MFKAIKDYTCEYGDFDIDSDLSFVKTYGTLAYFIINEYIRENMSIIIDYLKENNMTETDTERVNLNLNYYVVCIYFFVLKKILNT